MGALNDRLTDSVGNSQQGAANRDRDVRRVQGLLNVRIVKAGRGLHRAEISAHSGLDAVTKPSAPW